MISMEGSSQNRPANGEGAQASPMASGGRGRVNRERERVREWARVGEEDVLAFNAAYGVAGEELDGRHVAKTDDPRSRSR